MYLLRPKITVTSQKTEQHNARADGGLTGRWRAPLPTHVRVRATTLTCHDMLPLMCGVDVVLANAMRTRLRAEPYASFLLSSTSIPLPLPARTSLLPRLRFAWKRCGTMKKHVDRDDVGVGHHSWARGCMSQRPSCRKKAWKGFELVCGWRW